MAAKLTTPAPTVRRRTLLGAVPAAAVLLAVAPGMAIAQPKPAVTATRPITQPSLSQPATVAPRPFALPSGDYVLTMKYGPHSGAPLGSTVVRPVALTHSGTSLALVGPAGPSHPEFAGTVDAGGALVLTQPGGGSATLTGTATGSLAQGTVTHAHVPGQVQPPSGGFTLAPGP